MRNTYTLCLLALFMCLQAGAQKNFNHKFSANAIIQKEIQRLDSQFYTNYRIDSNGSIIDFYSTWNNNTWELADKGIYFVEVEGIVEKLIIK